MLQVKINYRKEDVKQGKKTVKGDIVRTEYFNVNNIADIHKIAQKHLNNDRLYTAYIDIVEECNHSNYSVLYDTAIIIVKNVINTIIKRLNADSPTYTNLLFNLRSGIYLCSVDKILNGTLYHFSFEIDDLIQEAVCGLWELYINGSDVEDCYLQGYKNVNAYMYASKKKPAKQELYIEDISGDIVSVDRAINAIVGKSLFILNTDDNKQAYQRAFIKLLLAECTPTQKQVLKWLGRGYSIRQTANKLNRNLKTVQEHIKYIRKKALAIQELYNFDI